MHYGSIALPLPALERGKGLALLNSQRGHRFHIGDQVRHQPLVRRCPPGKDRLSNGPETGRRQLTCTEIMVGMTTPGNGGEYRPDRASDRELEPEPRQGEVRPYEQRQAASMGQAQPPAVPSGRPPIILKPRPLSWSPGRFGAVWSHPIVVVAILFLILLLVVALAWALLREPQDIGSGAAEATQTPSPSASAFVLPTPSPASDSTAPEPVPSTSSEQSTEAGTDGLPKFGTSTVPPLASGVVRLELNDYGLLLNGNGEWRSASGWGGESNGEGSDINFTNSGITGRGGVQLARLNNIPLPNFETCKSQKAWTTSLNWEDATRGTFVCIRSGNGRRGLMRINEPPDFNGIRDSATVEVEGVIWAPIVDKQR